MWISPFLADLLAIPNGVLMFRNISEIFPPNLQVHLGHIGHLWKGPTTGPSISFHLAFPIHPKNTWLVDRNRLNLGQHGLGTFFDAPGSHQKLLKWSWKSQKKSQPNKKMLLFSNRHKGCNNRTILLTMQVTSWNRSKIWLEVSWSPAGVPTRLLTLKPFGLQPRTCRRFFVRPFLVFQVDPRCFKM